MPKGLRRAATALLIALGLYSLIGFLILPGVALRIACLLYTSDAADE